MIRKLFLFHVVLFIILGGLLYASGSLILRSVLVNWVYAISIFTLFFIVWYGITRLRIRLLHYLLLFCYYNYLLLTYLLFNLGKDILGVPITFRIIYPYIENYRLLINLVSISTIVYVVIGYVLIFVLVFYFWNKAYQYVQHKSSSRIQLKALLLGSISFAVLFIVFLMKFDVIQQKFKEHKLNEPYLTFLFFDEVFERQKEPGNENAVELANYTSPKGNGKNVVLIIADALRPDFFQSQEKLTPFIDSLIKTSDFTAHQNMFSLSAFSFNGISGILSSSDRLYEQNFFLHDVLKKQGYDINFILSGDMTNFWGLKNHITTESVDFYSDGYENFKFGSSNSLNDDQQNILNQLKKIESYKGVPTFFYVHMMSTHQIGDLKEKYKRFQPSNIDLSSNNFDPILLKNDYKNRMIQLNDYIQKLYNILKEKGYLEDYIFVLTADHGQSLGENDLYFHSKYINYESIKIPLIINYENIADTTQVANQLAIAPTILEALDLKIPKTWKGVALSDSSPKTVFQKQGDFYSMIWKEQTDTYQLHYVQKLNAFQLFGVSPNSRDKYKDILSQWPANNLDSLKIVLREKFQ